MFIATNKIEVPAAHQEHLAAAFERSVPDLKQFHGFLGFELWFAEDNTVLSVSRWEAKEDFEAYVNSETFRQHHGGASRELASGSSGVASYTARVYASK